MRERLEALGARIERVALDPSDIDRQTFFRVVRPFFVLVGWRAKVRCAALEGLVRAMHGVERGGEAAAEQARAALEAAVLELEGNVGMVERAAIIRRRPPVAHAAWLRRAWEVAVLASRALDGLEAGARDDAAIRAAAGVDRTLILAPLALESGARSTELVSEVPTRPIPEAEADARVVELELAAIDRLLDAARAERSILGRRRRLFVAARQRVLEACAALPVDRAGARARADAIAREIARIDRFERAGVSATAGLVHQARLAVTRGDPRTAYAALAALDGGALAAGDQRVATVTRQAIARLWTDGDPASAEERELSLLRSASDLLGGDVVTEINDAIARGRSEATNRAGLANTPEEREAAGVAEAHFGLGAELEIARSAVAVNGCFEVGGALTPVRVVEEERVFREVRHPTPDLRLVPARDVEDIADAVVGDPRTILLDLAAGRLLSRRFVREEARPRTRVLQRSEVRVYVLDGSGSMLGHRARVRDALLLAELGAILARFKSVGNVRTTLFYRYFDKGLGPVTRVDSVASAHAAIREICGTVREGGTDIEKALVASLAQVETARELDPDLSGAQIVLVTDGEANVDEAAVAQARACIRGIPVGVSVVALGQENPALRAIVARQRAKGERAFYHFLDDAQLAAIASGAQEDGLAVHLPWSPRQRAAAAAQELERELGPLVDELAAIERERDMAALEGLDAEVQARRETGDDDSADAGARARVEALRRDRTALEARFARWFPPPSSAAPGAVVPSPVSGSPERDDVDAVCSALASVAEVVALLEGGGDLARRADAIELFERLLPDAHLTPARYREVVREWPIAVAPALRAVHDAVEGG